MANVFIEVRSKQEGSPVAEYVVADQAGDILASFLTRNDAIYWAKTHGHTPYVARISHLKDRNNPDHWLPA